MDISELIYKINDLRSEGYCCSQIVVKMLAEDCYYINDEILIQAMSALGYGLHSKKTCGVLTGCACALAVCNEEKAYNKLLVKELVYWFENEFGSCDCNTILDGKIQDAELCTEIVAKSVNKCMVILQEMESGIVSK